jgi:hypothetical protein
MIPQSVTIQIDLRAMPTRLYQKLVNHPYVLDFPWGSARALPAA